MDTQTRNLTETAPGLAYCDCQTPRTLLIPRADVGEPGRWAVCPTCGVWWENRGDGVYVRAVAGQATLVTGRAQWTGGDALPAIVPGVRIDLSKESYA